MSRDVPHHTRRYEVSQPGAKPMRFEPKNDGRARAKRVASQLEGGTVRPVGSGCLTLLLLAVAALVLALVRAS